MRSKTIPTIILLSISVLLAIPAAFLQVNAVTQSGPSTWSPFGARPNQIVWKVYADDTAMLADFDAGLVDLADIPDRFSRISSDEINANYYVTSAISDFGEFQNELSHQVTFLGKTLQCSRFDNFDELSCLAGGGSSPKYKPQATSLVVNSNTPPSGGCLSSQFRLIVHLRNWEYDNAAADFADATEVISATPPAGAGASVSDAADGSLDGSYNLGCLSGGASQYAVKTFLYGNTDNTVVTKNVLVPGQCSSGNTCDVTLNVNYRSPSTKKPTTYGIELGRAHQYLADRPNFASTGQGVATLNCVDIYGTPAQALMPINLASACGDKQAGVDTTTLNEDCLAANLGSAAGKPAGFVAISPCTPVSLYNLSADSIAASPSCATNSLGSQIPTLSCFPSRGNQGDTTILATSGYSGQTDLTAACDHYLLAGFTISPAGANCTDVALGNVVSGVTAHLNNGGQQIASYVRQPGVFPARPRYGQIIADTEDFLFGTPAPTGGTVCYGQLTPTPGPGATCSAAANRQLYTIGQVGGIVFTAQPTWNHYTGGQSHGTTSDALIFSYHSSFASDTCGGLFADFPDQYVSYCDPVFDTYDWAGEFSVAAYADSYAVFQKVVTLAATRGLNMPMYAQSNKFLALNAWNNEPLGTPFSSSLVNAFGNGFQAGGRGAFWSLQNMRDSGLVTSGIYQAGGGDPTTIRRAMSGGGTLHLNVLASANTVWEVDPLAMIWDTMLLSNPLSAGATIQYIDWMTKSHTQFFDAATGQNTQTFNLRNDLCWQDATSFNLGSIPPCNRPVTADDVCFSILMERDGPGLGKVAVQDVLTCSYPDSQTVVVRHQGISSFQPVNIGAGVPILPAHLWGPYCGWAGATHNSATEPNVAYNAGTGVGVVASPCVDESFDPMLVMYLGAPFTPVGGSPLPSNVNGLMVGSGSYMCVVPPGFGALSGKIGGSCALNSAGDTLVGQGLAPGNTLRLVSARANYYVEGNSGKSLYNRCCDPTQGSSLQALGWADVNNDGKVTIVDASTLSSVFGVNDKYFDHRLFGSTSGQVDIVEASFLASYFDSGLIANCISFQCPGPPSQLTPAGPLIQPDQAIDPYQANLGGGKAVYYKGLTVSAGTGTLELATVSGSVTPADFTASIDGGGLIGGAADGVHPGNVVFTTALASATGHTIVVKYLGTTIFVAKT